MMPTEGQGLGHYRIQALLGAGGMGEVYRALDTQLNRAVAIKFLSSQFADPSARRRFQHEARMASALNHPHILTVYEAGETGDRQYLVTELVEGGTLDDWGREAGRTWRQVVELLVGVADGLAAAHEAGILHRDVKPANILVTKSGYAKLADFGLAKLDELVRADGVTRAPTADPTRPGMVVGTVPYMSPEQASGRPLDARSDIFSFGLVLYELLAGSRAFVGRTDLDTLRAIVHDEPRPLPSDLPIELRLFVGKALEKDPADRYQSMRELVIDLRRGVRRTGGPSSSRAESTDTGSRRWLWVGTSLTCVALAGGLWMAFGAPWFARSAEDAPNPLANAHFTRLTDFAGDELDAAISPDGKFVAFVSDRDGPFDVWLSQIGSGAFLNLTVGKDPALPAPVRAPGFSQDGSQVWLGGGTGRRLQIMPLMGGGLRPYLSDRVVTVAWSPDSSRMVYHTRDSGDPLFVADRDGSNARQVFVGSTAGVHNHFPVWSLDGRWIMFVSGSPPTDEMDLWRIAPEGGAPERLTNHNSVVGYPAPIDARTVMYVAGDEAGAGPWLWALDLERRRSRRVSLGLELYTSVAASADGTRLAATVANPTSNLWSVPILDRLADERDVRPFPVPNVSAAGPLFADTSLFYVSSGASGSGLWRYRDGEAVELWRAGEDPLLTAPGISRDVGRVALALRRNGRLRMHLLSADGAELQPLTNAIDARGGASWSPDQQWIVTGGSDSTGEGLFRIPIDGGSPVKIVTGPALDPVWSPAGSLIVYSGANVGSHAPLLGVRPDGKPFPLPSIQVRREGGGGRSRFTPDGRRLIYMQGLALSQDFWLLDLETQHTRQLTRLNHQAAMWGFDISRDGKLIVFDRSRDASDIVLIDLSRTSRTP